MSMKRLLKKVLPASWFSVYHRFLAKFAAVVYGEPSERMIVIGVTGTNGKSTTANFIAAILEEAGFRVGLATTVNFRIAGKERLNDTKMTMLGRFRLQALLAEMLDAGCDYAVIETSSEGIRQYRHLGINYDVAVFTNLTPEHIESHGGFDKYRETKGELFAKLSRDRRKVLGGAEIKKTIVANLASSHAPYFLSFAADHKIGFFVGGGEVFGGADATVKAEELSLAADGSRFSVDTIQFDLHLPGSFNIENALAAVAVAISQKIDLSVAAKALQKVSGVPGRMERIDCGQPFTVLVDYAPEPESFRKLYEVVPLIPHGRVIHVLGSTGGGRDIARRPVLGRLAAENADVVVITNEDPYDDDPAAIIEDVARGAEAAGKRRGQNLHTVLDRRQAIEIALGLAASGDLVIVTGKGAEQAMVVAGGKKIPWDDRDIIRRILKKV